MARFHTREEAGRLLAERLMEYAHRPDVVVCAVPHGGVPVAAEIARVLDAPLTLIPVHRLALPGCEDVSLGAVAHGAIVALNEDIIAAYDVPNGVLAELIAGAQEALKHEELDHPQAFQAQELRGKTVILVDDGVSTGTTLRAALAAVRSHDPTLIVIAVPVATYSVTTEMVSKADEVVSLSASVPFGAVRDWYDEPVPMTDAAGIVR